MPPKKEKIRSTVIFPSRGRPFQRFLVRIDGFSLLLLMFLHPRYQMQEPRSKKGNPRKIALGFVQGSLGSQSFTELDKRLDLRLLDRDLIVLGLIEAALGIE